MFHLHVGVLAFPFGTHAAPSLALVQRLSVSAPDILFSFFNSASSNSKVFDERALITYPNIRARDVWDGTPRGEVFTGSHFEAVGLFLKASPGNFEKVIEEAEVESGVKISCLITDAFLWFGCDLAEKKGVPWLAFWTSASCSLSAHMYTDQLLKAIQSTAGSEEQVKIQSLIPGLELAELDDLPSEIFYDKNPSPLALTLNNMVQNLPKSTAVILNSLEEIDPIITKDLKSKFHHFLNVGPSILTSPPSATKQAAFHGWC